MSAIGLWVKRIIQTVVWVFLAYVGLLAALGLYAVFRCGIPAIFGRLAEGCAR